MQQLSIQCPSKLDQYFLKHTLINKQWWYIYIEHFFTKHDLNPHWFIFVYYY